MADGNSKTAHQVAIELVKAIRAELDAQRGLAKSVPAKAEFSPQEAAQAIGAAIRKQIKEYEGELVKMRQREAEALSKSLYGMPSGAPPAGKLGKTVFECMKPADTKKAETFIDVKNSNDPAKRDVTVGGKGSVLPGDKKSKKVSAEGSGGETKLGKEALGSTNATGDKPGKPGDKPATSAVPTPPKAAALKPAGVPGMKAGEAPKVPEVPKAPGMKKEELDKMMGKPPAAPSSQKKPLGIPSGPVGNTNAKMNMGNAFQSLNTPPVKKEEMPGAPDMEKGFGPAPAAPSSQKKPLGIPANPGNPNAKMNMGNAFQSLNTPPAAPPAPMKSPALAAAAAKKALPK